MTAELQTLKAPEPEVIALDVAPGVEQSRPEGAPWLAQRVLGTAGGDPRDLPGMLARADTGTRVRLVGELQRRHGNAHVQRLLAAPSSSGAASGAVGQPRRGIPVAIRLRVISEVEDIAFANKARALPMGARQVDTVVDAVRRYAEQGNQAYGRGETDGPSAYVDLFVETCLKRAYDRGIIATDYANAWDDTLENASDEQQWELSKLLSSVASQYASYRPTADPDAASFWTDVGDPVLFKAFQLLSFGIVDKELFSESSQLIKVNDYEGLIDYVELRVGRAVLDTFTLGMGSAFLQGIWDEAERNPNATTRPDQVFAAGGKAALEAFLPKHELETIYAHATGRPIAPGELPPDFFEAMEAFFMGMMKVIGIIGAAKGTREYVAKHGVTKAPPRSVKGSVAGEVLHGGKAKPAEEPAAGKGDDAGTGAARAPMRVADAVALLKNAVRGRKWTEVVKDPTVDINALEMARSTLAERIDPEGVRTGRIGPGHDLDITVKSNAQAQRWMEKAVKELFAEDLTKVSDARKIELMEGVKDALDVNVSTDAGRVTFYDAKGLRRSAAVTAESAGLKAAQMARLRILKGLAANENPAAGRLFENAAREMGVDPATVKPLDRLPTAKLPRETKARIEVLKKQLDTLAKINDTRPTDFTAKRIVELQTELLTLDPEAYLYAGGVKAEVILQEPRATFRAGKGQGRLSAREAQGNIENNHLNAINEISKALKGLGEADIAKGQGSRIRTAYEHAGGKPAFSKYVWRVLRTAQKFGVEVNPDLLARSERINLGKAKAVASEMPTEAARGEYARACLDEILRVETAFKARRIELPSGPMTFTTVYDSSGGAGEDVPFAADEADLVGSITADVLDAGRSVAPSPQPTAPPAPIPTPGRVFGPGRETGRTGSGGIVVDERTRAYEAGVLPALYLRQRGEIRDQILRRIREEGRSGLDVNSDGATTPASAWWDCLLNADAEDYFDAQAGIMITPKEPAVDLEGAIVEIDNFLSVEPAFPVFIGLYRSGLSDYAAGRIRSPAGAGRR